MRALVRDEDCLRPAARDWLDKLRQRLARSRLARNVAPPSGVKLRDRLKLTRCDPRAGSAPVRASCPYQPRLHNGHSNSFSALLEPQF
jgi:hypothetical protein